MPSIEIFISTHICVTLLINNVSFTYKTINGWKVYIRGEVPLEDKSNEDLLTLAFQYKIAVFRSVLYSIYVRFYYFTFI